MKKLQTMKVTETVDLTGLGVGALVRVSGGKGLWATGRVIVSGERVEIVKEKGNIGTKGESLTVDRSQVKEVLEAAPVSQQDDLTDLIADVVQGEQVAMDLADEDAQGIVTGPDVEHDERDVYVVEMKKQEKELIATFPTLSEETLEEYVQDGNAVEQKAAQAELETRRVARMTESQKALDEVMEEVAETKARIAASQKSDASEPEVLKDGAGEFEPEVLTGAAAKAALETEMEAAKATRKARSAKKGPAPREPGLVGVFNELRGSFQVAALIGKGSAKEIASYVVARTTDRYDGGCWVSRAGDKARKAGESYVIGVCDTASVGGSRTAEEVMTLLVEALEKAPDVAWTVNGMEMTVHAKDAVLAA